MFPVKKISLIDFPVAWEELFTPPSLSALFSNRIPSLEEEWSRPPPADLEVVGKTSTAAKTHTHDFVIYDRAIWTRRHGNKDWERVPFQGEPLIVKADGANLIALGDDGLVYKKVLLEVDRHAAFDKAVWNNWKDSWFRLPYFKYVNMITGKYPPIEKGQKFAISHKGFFNTSEGEKAGKKRSVTTLGVLSDCAEKLRMRDPFSPPWAVIEVYFPQTPEKVFLCKNFDLSASRIMAIGYEVDLATSKKTLKLITRYFDLDDGYNPALKYTFEKSENPNARTLSLQSPWKEHPLPKGEVTEAISLFQIGEGDALEMRITSRDGYYTKMLGGEEWEFVKARVNRLPFLKKEDICLSLPVPKVRDLTGEIVCRGNHFTNVEFKNFGEGSNLCDIFLDYEGKKIRMQLYWRYTLWTFLGADIKRYDLIVPPELRRFFGGKASVKVWVQEEEGKLKLADPGIIEASATRLIKKILIKNLLQKTLQETA